MSNSKVLSAVYFQDGKNPKCPKCLYSLEPKTLDYGVDGDNLFFISPCGMCESPVKYITDAENINPIKTKTVERKA